MHLGKTATLSCDKYRADPPRSISSLLSQSFLLCKNNHFERKRKQSNSCPPCNDLVPSTCQTREKLSPAVQKAPGAALIKRKPVGQQGGRDSPALRAARSSQGLPPPAQLGPWCWASAGSANTVTGRDVNNSLLFPNPVPCIY